MYLNKYPSLYAPQKEAAKCSKIFRPWDNPDDDQFGLYPRKCEKFDNCAQDATISTTTENEDNEPNNLETKLIRHDNKSECSNEKTGKNSIQEIKKNKSEKLDNPKEKQLNGEHKSFLQENIQTMPPFTDYPGEGYHLYPDFVHLNLAHSLGLTPTDPLFLECVNQGCTLEEYTRVLSQEQQAKILSARKQRPKKHRCPHCNVGFSNNGQLKGHIRIHTGERPFRCEENNCGKTFTRNEELTRHKRIHSGLRPFPCTHCGKRFGRKDHLKKHSRTHFQPRGLYAVPVMLPYETWTSQGAYPYVPMFTY